MVRKDPAFLRRLLATFKIEAEEHIRALSTGILDLEKLDLEKEPDASRQEEIIEMIFREAHSLKGAARTVNQAPIESVCQSLESLFSALKRKDLELAPSLLDLLHQAVDGLDELLGAVATQSATEQSLTENAAAHIAAVPQLSETLRKIDALAEGRISTAQIRVSETKPASPTTSATTSMPDGTTASAQPEPTDPSGPQVAKQAIAEASPQLAETVRISADYLESLLLQAEELVAVKLSARQRRSDLARLATLISTWDREWSKVRADVLTLSRLHELDKQAKEESNKQDKLPAEVARLLAFVLQQQDLVESLEDNLKTVGQAAEQDYRLLGGMIDNLRQDMKQALMMPFSSLLDLFPKLVRDLARDQGKITETVIEGADLNVDRRILQEIKDPLIHLVRNCLDHGIEKPEVRQEKQKPRRGTVTLAVTEKDNSKIEVMVADDGAGIDFAKVHSVAVSQGLVNSDTPENLSEQELSSLIFQSGLSTSPLITDISGRGLGLAIVQEKVERLGGAISLTTRPNQGTTFRILLPSTLTTFQGLLVNVEQQLFVLPLTYVERVARINPETIQTIENRAAVWLDGEAVAIVPLEQVLELSATGTTSAADGAATKTPIVVLRAAGERIAFSVDEIGSVQEVLVKSLGPQLVRVRNIAGATVLGDGQIALILNISDVMKSAIWVASGQDQRQSMSTEAPSAQQSILVVEDSITTRTQLRDILELAGYRVETAVDGMAGWMALTEGEFDLVVSDIDMPRLNGIDLTARIRQEQKLVDLPVVLVTALASPEDRERGVEAGANAYIVKSNFDQDNLLDVIRQLI